jgi:hypothetical protein
VKQKRELDPIDTIDTIEQAKEAAGDAVSRLNMAVAVTVAWRRCA